MTTGGCCPDCSPQCQLTGMALGQLAGFADGWWGEPFSGGVNTQAAVFWADECCPDCAFCPICQGG